MLTRIIILFFVLSSQLAIGQSGDDRNQTERPSSDRILEDQSKQGRDTTTIVGNAFFDIFYGNPGKAALYGLLVPGGGQIYNKKWWKLPFVYAVEGGTIYWIMLSTREYGEFQDAYIDKLVNDPINFKGYRGVTDQGVLKSYRDKWRKQREYSWIIFIGGHLITIFEAFIDRHLMEFDVSDDLTFEPIPSIMGPTLGLTYAIPLNRKKDIVYKDW